MSMRDRIGSLPKPGRPSFGIPKPDFRLRERLAAVNWLLVAAIVAAVLYVAWVAYTAADHGVDRGLGVLVGVPALLLLAVIVIVPFAGAAILIRRLRGSSDGDEDDESMTGETFPL